MKNYIDDVVFTEEILKSIEKNDLSEESVLSYKLIVTNMIKSTKYNNYPEEVKYDMQNTSYVFFLKYWKNFSTIKNNIKKIIKKHIDIQKDHRIFINELSKFVKENKKIPKYENITNKKISKKDFQKFEKELIEKINWIFEHKTGAYSYFTNTCERGFFQEIKKYYKYNEKFDVIYNNSKDELQELYSKSEENSIDSDY